MLRRLLSLFLVILCAGFVTANAQSMGGDTSSQSDCSNPMNAGSAACMGGSTGSQQMNPNAYGQGAYGQGAYGQSPYGQGTSPMQNGSNPLAGYGIHSQVPNFIERIPYGYGMTGAYRNPQGKYGNFGPVIVEPPTEFQRIVAGATGAKLPIFGADLFFGQNAQFAPVDRTPVTSDYVIGPGDQLLIRVWGQVNFNAQTTVDRAGDIYIPQVGNIEVSGLHFEQLDGYLKKQMGRVFRNFDLSVNMGQLRSIQIYVVGNAQRPGSYTLSSLSTLVNALFSSGGPSPQGSMRKIQLKRGGTVVTTFDLYDLLIYGDKSHDAPLLPGDVIYIPPVGPQVAVAGSVHVPAIYELAGPETAGEAITMAGGLATMASKQDAQLDRTDAQGTRRTIQLTLDGAGLKTELQDGDILRISSMVQRFDETVILRGNVANPGRYRWTPGMRVSDLIPDEASLETRGYWQRRIALGLPAPEYKPLFRAYNPTLPSMEQQLTQENNGKPGAYTTGTSLAQTDTMQPGQQSLLLSNQAASQPAAAAAAQNSGVNGSPYQGAQTYPGAYPNNALNGQPQGQNPQKPRSTLPLTEQFNGDQQRYYPPGDRFSQGQFPIRNEILRTAPSIDWSYASIERTNPQTLQTKLIPFSLGKAVLDHDPSQNLELKPNDVITVFSTADIHVPQAQQVKYVRLEGEVVHAGIYSVQPGETLRDVVRRAGGLTPNAYLYGSEFLRESTQRLQQERLNEYVNTIERDIELSSANAAGKLVNATGASALSTSAQSQQQLVATLRRMRATGRIVLGLTPFSQGVDALPNLTLQDGDQFIVPPMPATVNVVGAVYDQNSFLYRRGNHVGDYLHVAGGGTRNADKRHEFVIRADGSVISKQTSGGTVFGGGFDSRLAYPGDTVVVPDNIDKTTLLRGLTDWSTVFSQFGLGVAALTLFGL